MKIVAVKKRDTSKCLDNNLKHLQIINYESASQLYMEGFHDDPFDLLFVRIHKYQQNNRENLQT